MTPIYAGEIDWTAQASLFLKQTTRHYTSLPGVKVSNNVHAVMIALLPQ
jgi:hypothetical protein